MFKIRGQCAAEVYFCGYLFNYTYGKDVFIYFTILAWFILFSIFMYIFFHLIYIYILICLLVELHSGRWTKRLRR